MQTIDDHEREVKFFIADLNEISARLIAARAVLTKERVHEYNLRFDTRDHSLRSRHQVLRLRKDDQVRLTFKDQADLSEGIADRQELEITINDFESTKRILEALGFVVFLIYEKYRTTYQFGECEVVLDELPFGFFVEIEGLTVDAIHTAASKLGLDWEKRITLSYLELFGNLKANKKLQIDHILFKNFPSQNFIEADFL